MTEVEIATKPYAGRYPFIPLEEMSTTEWGWLIDLTGYLPAKVDAALQGGDPRVVTMVAVVALHRAGKITPADVTQAYKRLADQPAAFKTIDFITEEVDADPPPTETAASTPSSGQDSNAASARSATAPNGSGTPPSVSSPLPPVRSGI